MNSFNHYSYGSIGEWLYKVVAGLRPDENQPGFKHILIQPQPGGKLTFARIRLDTLYGVICTGWERVDHRMTLHASIPANTTAAITLPGAALDNILLDGMPAEGQAGVHGIHQTDMGVEVEIGSGNYVFTFPCE